MAKKTKKSQPFDLAKMFQAVSGVLIQNQESLNQADEYNHDHGDHMVDIFRVITQAMEEKRGADPADQLAYASELLRSGSQSGSGKIYAQGLSQAAKQVQGQGVTTHNILPMIQALLGEEQTTGSPTQRGGALPDLLGSLLSPGGEMQGSVQGQAAGQFDLGDLLSLGGALLQSTQQGSSVLDSLVNTLVGSSQVGQTSHRAQSGQLIASTLLQVARSMSAK